MARIGTLIDKKYEIISKIGEGGMSIVWLARDKRLSKLWAVKEIKKKTRDRNNTVVVQSLITEANLMKRLDHSALPRVVDIIEDESELYVVMDYIEGDSLAVVMKRTKRPMSQEDVIDWGIQLCDVLLYLHSCIPPVIYRDMKPSNIILREDNTIKLIDFGIAREYKTYRSSDTVNLGTRGYAAPEQFQNDAQSDARTDIFSLGVTLYHLVTGHSPNQEPFELLPIRQWNPELSEGLERIIIRCTQNNPDRRYQTCTELRYDLEHYEKLTEEYRSTQRKKVTIFYRQCTAAAVCLALGIGFFSASFIVRNSSYSYNMEQAAVSSLQEEEDGGASPAERFYTTAIEVLPTEVEPYSQLVNVVYKNDFNFSVSEAQRWNSVFSEYQSDIKQSNGYAKLCYDVGILYFIYYDYGDELTRGSQAAQWFQYVIDDYDSRLESGSSCTLTEEERRAAEVYATIGRFYQNLSQSSLEGREGVVYEDYWDALESACEIVESEDSVNDSAIIKLRLYQLIFEAIASPTYLTGFSRVGVTASQAQEMLDRITQAVVSLEDEARQNELSESMFETVTNGYDEAMSNIAYVYENAGIRSTEFTSSRESEVF